MVSHDEVHEKRRGGVGYHALRRLSLMSDTRLGATATAILNDIMDGVYVCRILVHANFEGQSRDQNFQDMRRMLMRERRNARQQQGESLMTKLVRAVREGEEVAIHDKSAVSLAKYAKKIGGYLDGCGIRRTIVSKSSDGRPIINLAPMNERNLILEMHEKERAMIDSDYQSVLDAAESKKKGVKSRVEVTSYPLDYGVLNQPQRFYIRIRQRTTCAFMDEATFPRDQGEYNDHRCVKLDAAIQILQYRETNPNGPPLRVMTEEDVACGVAAAVGHERVAGRTLVQGSWDKNLPDRTPQPQRQEGPPKTLLFSFFTQNNERIKKASIGHSIVLKCLTRRGAGVSMQRRDNPCARNDGFHVQRQTRQDPRGI